MLENMIYDRTAEDVEQGTDKGFYRHTDLNRVQAAVLAVRERFGDMGYEATTIPLFWIWAENAIPRTANMNLYIQAVKSLDGLIPMPGKPVLPLSMDKLDYIGANAIEKFLVMMDDSADRIAGAWFYCDEVFSGEVDL